MKDCHRERVPGPGSRVFVWVPNHLGRINTDRNKEITRLRHEEGLRLAEIGERFEISKQRVCRIAGPLHKPRETR